MSIRKIHRRPDITEKVWTKLSPLLPGHKGTLGRLARDNRRCINAVCWIFSTGTPWRDLPPDYGIGTIRIDVAHVGVIKEHGATSWKRS